jgi:hypothetical protein
MKNLFAALLVSGAFYFAACTKAVPYAPYVVKKSDSTTNKGNFNITFNSKSLYMEQLSVLKIAEHEFVSNTKSFDQADTLFITQVSITDRKSKMMSMKLTVYNNTSGMPVGTYVVRNNDCTFTDFADGKNQVYAIEPGGTVDITETGVTTKGTFNFILRYNTKIYPATGNFVVNNF